MNVLSALILTASPAAVVPFIRPAAPESHSLAEELELISDAVAGRRTAQHALYVRYYDRVRARILRLLGRSSEVDDVLQDTFIEAFRDLKHLNDAQRFGGWICGIAVHQVHRRLRRRQLLQRLGFDRHVDEATLAQSLDPAASPETLLLIKQLDRALNGLPPRQRLAWMLRYVEGCNLDEVAEQCRTSIATAKRDIAMAETHLSTRLFDQGSNNER